MNSKKVIATLIMGFAMATLLIFNSVRTYQLVSRKIEVEQVRRNASAFAATFEKVASKQSLESLEQLLARQVAASSGTILSAHIRNGQEEVLAQAGLDVVPQFTKAQLVSQWRQRKQVFRRVATASGVAIVVAFPIHLQTKRPESSQFRLATFENDPSRPRVAILHVAASLDGGADLSILRRNLLLNCTAAMALMGSLVLIAARWKAYLRGQMLTEEVEAAALVQREMMPHHSEPSAQLELTAHYAPAGTVSGDFYDTFDLEDSKTAIVLGDVSGKGVPAALLTGLIEGVVRAGQWSGDSGEHESAAARLNKLLCDRAAAERYATMFWSYFDRAAMNLHYINAGHFPPMLFRAATGDILKLEDGGSVLGVIPAAIYKQAVVSIEEGDLLVLYSDGILDACNAQGEPFGESRLSHVVELYQERPAEEIRDLVLWAVKGFAGSQPAEDDRTLLILRFDKASA